jgi:beta-phosphoglucomutase-like phosphatase (HAD superfamily)
MSKIVIFDLDGVLIDSKIKGFIKVQRFAHKKLIFNNVFRKLKIVHNSPKYNLVKSIK